MSRDELLPYMNAMEIYGGSFTKALAKAMYLADSNNLDKIFHAFAPLIHSYHKFVEIEKENQEKFTKDIL